MGDHEHLLRAVDGLGPLVRSSAPAASRRRRLPDDVVASMRECGLQRLWIPRRYGGYELPLPVALSIYQAAAWHDGSFAWSVMIGAGGGLFAAYLAPDIAEELFGPKTALVAGSGAPNGRAERVPGGFDARGRWRYASGAHDATVFTANCVLYDSGCPLTAPAGGPQVRALVFRPEDVLIHDTWDTTGLRATDSEDIEVRGAFVPEARSFSVLTDQPVVDGPLYRIPFDVLTGLPVASVALGLAERALAEFRQLAVAKPTSQSGAPLGGLESVRDAVAAADASIAGAFVELNQRARQVWKRAVAGDEIDALHVRRCTHSSIRAARDLVAAIARLVPLAGMNAVRIDDPFSCAWRDLEAVAAHASLSPLLLG
jgi:alkylation response protein AidB-like acyl-CoA dehydrogenase